jgi:hypothetical protein
MTLLEEHFIFFQLMWLIFSFKQYQGMFPGKLLMFHDTGFRP